MRRKFLSIIVGFLALSIAISSCLDSDDSVYELSSDATVRAFGIDTIHGKYYKFTIDQLRKIIYNKDSLPVGSDTVIDKILIDTFSVGGYITTGLMDTLFVMTDSVDLRPAMNPDSETGGMKFKIHAADGVTTCEYTLQVRVHLQDPDSLVWKNMAEVAPVFSEAVNIGRQKAIILNEGGKEQLLVYTSPASAYKTSTADYVWNGFAVTGLPQDVRLASATNFLGTLYMLTESGDVYASVDGAAWSKEEGLSGGVTSLVACFPENDMSGVAASLAGVLDADGRHFCTTTDGKTWNIHGAVPENFPDGDFCYTLQNGANGVDKVYAVGLSAAEDTKTLPWFSLDGKEWISLDTQDAACPYLSNPSILWYGDNFYCWGGSLEAIYSSLTGIAWYETESKFMLPEGFKDKGAYSMDIDSNRFIWMVFGGEGKPNEVWRGRLNKLGFEEQ